MGLVDFRGMYMYTARQTEAQMGTQIIILARVCGKNVMIRMMRSAHECHRSHRVILGVKGTPTYHPAQAKSDHI